MRIICIEYDHGHGPQFTRPFVSMLAAQKYKKLMDDQWPEYKHFIRDLEGDSEQKAVLKSGQAKPEIGQAGRAGSSSTPAPTLAGRPLMPRRGGNRPRSRST